MSEMRLVLENSSPSNAPHSFVYRGGQMSVGRGEDSDWRIHDPEHFVSRRHFLISADADGVLFTDSSSGGLFVDDSSVPLGAGNSVYARDGMRLRFGDFTARVELLDQPTAAAALESPDALERISHKSAFDSPFNFEFGDAEPAEPIAPRPENLPDSFGRKSSDFFSTEEASKPPAPIDRDDPFLLGLPATRSVEQAAAGHESSRPARSFFDSDQTSGLEPTLEDPIDASEAIEPPIPSLAQSDADLAKDKFAERNSDEFGSAVPSPVSEGDRALREALYAGMGLRPEELSVDETLAEMEALGRRFRALSGGVTQLLRTRSGEKQKLRIAQTIVGASNVNPLKFAASAEEAAGALVTTRGAGYLDPDASIEEAFRDLIDHQMRTWAALQTALRRMIDKFDPSAIEQELSDSGLLETLIAGGKSAKLWQLYQDRYQDLARSAEERFLGEVGGDFRDAYEG